MSIVEERWRANRLLKERAKRDKFKIAEEKKSELAKIKAEGMAAGRLQQRAITADEDKAREQRVNKFYSERRYGSLLEARGRDDPMVQEAGRRLGYDSGGFVQAKRAGALKQMGAKTTGGGEVAPKYGDVTNRIKALREEPYSMTGPEIDERLGLGRSPDKTKSIADNPPFVAKQAPTDKIYEGTVQRGGKSYRAFSDTQKQGYGEYKPTRLVPPGQVPPAPSIQTQPSGESIRATQHTNKAATQKTGAAKEIKAIDTVFKRPAQKGQSTVGLLKTMGKAMADIFGPDAAPEWTKWVPFSQRNLRNMGRTISSGTGFNFMPGKDHTSTSPETLNLRELMKRSHLYRTRGGF